MAIILIVDDEVFIRGVTEMMVQDLGHETLVASDPDEALVHLQSAQNPSMRSLLISASNQTCLAGLNSPGKPSALRPKLRVLYTTGSSHDRQDAGFVC